MPDKALKFCGWNGCNELVTARYCKEHQALADEKQQQEKNRYKSGSSTKAGYDVTWQRVRKQYLSSHPLCEMCKAEGNVTQAYLVHHIKPIKDGGARLDKSNMMALCNPHHEEIHKKDRWKHKTSV